MIVIPVENVHTALPEVLHQLDVKGVKRESRNGPVVMFPEPTAIVYKHPTQRVIRWDERDANPFFHFFESLWMLNGQRDVAFVEQFASNMTTYSDDGKVFNAAYGHRWRSWFKIDQIATIIEALRADRDSRRQYLAIWDGSHDLGLQSKDLPCNVGATFQVNDRGELDMTVHNRSNDIVWGALGANAVHFSMLQEFVAGGVGVPVGRYWQVSSNLHAYEKTLAGVQMLADHAADGYRTRDLNYYKTGVVQPYEIMSVDYKTWQQDLAIFLKEGPIIGFREKFFRQVATPLWQAHRAFKSGTGAAKYDTALEILEQCRAADWRMAAMEWIQRRRAKWLRAKDDGVQA